MWEHNYQPIGGSLALSALVAVIPIVVLFVMLGALRKPAWMSATTALGSALGILPGGGALLASFGAYTLEKKISRNPSEFGKGG